MSWAAYQWARKQTCGKGSDKLVLFALADCHNEDSDLAWPSIAWLSEFCELDRKTVILAVARLEAAGLLIDSGLRVGQTKQVKVYRLPIERVPEAEQYQKRNSPDFSGEESRKRDTEPTIEPTKPSITEAPAKKKSRSKPKNTGPLPASWQPEEFGPETNSQKIIAGWSPDRLDLEVEKFKAWHGARDNRFSSWQQAWATWVLRTKNESYQRKGNGNANSDRKDSRDGFERALDQSMGSDGSATGCDDRPDQSAGSIGRRDTGSTGDHRHIADARICPD